MATWPAELPQSPLIEGYEPDVGDPFIRSSNEQGPKITRKRYTAVPDPVNWPIMVTHAQYAILLEFFKDFGHAPFTLTDPLTGVAASYRFTDKPKPQIASHNRLRVVLPLEKLP